MIWEIFQWVNNIINLTLTGFIFTALITITTIISLYFNFQLYTNLATIASKYFCPQEDGLLMLRTVYTILITTVSIIPILPIPEDIVEIISVVLIGITVIMLIATMIILFGFKNALKEETLE